MKLLVAALLCIPGAALADEPWRVTVPESVDAEVDAPAAASLAISVRDGYTISRDGPVVIDLHADPPAALTLPRRRLQRRDAADAQADAPRFDLRFKARAEGDHHLLATVRFWLCAHRTCRPVRTSAAVTVHAHKPAPPPPPPSP
ncbi:MAG TPA: hypothetical protein VL172_07320 [Kofleriaceae bacterium]|nr:hypothetical protein [Kofleriaceae bacterium]